MKIKRTKFYPDSNKNVDLYEVQINTIFKATLDRIFQAISAYYKYTDVVLWAWHLIYFYYKRAIDRII